MTGVQTCALPIYFFWLKRFLLLQDKLKYIYWNSCLSPHDRHFFIRCVGHEFIYNNSLHIYSNVNFNMLFDLVVDFENRNQHVYLNNRRTPFSLDDFEVIKGSSEILKNQLPDYKEYKSNFSTNILLLGVVYVSSFLLFGSAIKSMV